MLGDSRTREMAASQNLTCDSWECTGVPGSACKSNWGDFFFGSCQKTHEHFVGMFFGCLAILVWCVANVWWLISGVFLISWSFNHRCLLIPSRVFPSFFMDVHPISSWKPTAPHPQNVPVVIGHPEPLWRRISARELHLRWLSSDEKRQLPTVFLAQYVRYIHASHNIHVKQYNYDICIWRTCIYIYIYL